MDSAWSNEGLVDGIWFNQDKYVVAGSRCWCRSALPRKLIRKLQTPNEAQLRIRIAASNKAIDIGAIMLCVIATGAYSEVWSRRGIAEGRKRVAA